MGTINRFEDLEVWQVSMNLVSAIYKITSVSDFSMDFGLRDQIRRSAVSIPSNIAEGFERDSQRQFVYSLLIAKGSCGELRTQLKIANNLQYLNEQDFEQINEKCFSVSKQLAGFIKYLRTKTES